MSAEPRALMGGLKRIGSKQNGDCGRTAVDGKPVMRGRLAGFWRGPASLRFRAQPYPIARWFRPPYPTRTYPKFGKFLVFMDDISKPWQIRPASSPDK